MSESAQPVPNPAKLAAAQAGAFRAYKSPLAWTLFLTPAILGIAADLSFKAWAFPDGPPIGRPAFFIVPRLLEFVTTINTGMVFGLGAGKVSIFEAFSWVALAIILWVFATSDARHRVVHFALGMITAGAIGNLYDRAMFHGVRDMLRFNVSWYPYVFNIADALLCIGVPLLIARWMFIKDPDPINPKKHGFPPIPPTEQKK